MKTPTLLKCIFTFLAIFASTIPALAKDDVGSVVALKGKAVIERNQGKLDAKVKDPILLLDAVNTPAASKVKLLFIDDSVLTLGENSRMVVKEFILSKEGRGKSIFNLLEGKMRSVVGKTKFEVHTPTAVAAARGTVIYFEVGFKDGKEFTTITCLEGEVEVSSSIPGVTGSALLTPGMAITVIQGDPLPMPAPASTPELERLKRETSTSGSEISMRKAEIITTDASIMKMELPFTAAPIQQQPLAKQPTKVNININIR